MLSETGKKSMAVKAPKARSRSKKRILPYGRQLRELITEQRALTKKLSSLLEEIEDAADHALILEAKRQNGGKPAIPWSLAKKRLGID
jgi:hypothetical protein